MSWKILGFNPGGASDFPSRNPSRRDMEFTRFPIKWLSQLFPGGKAAKYWSWPSTPPAPRLRMCRWIFNLPTRLYVTTFHTHSFSLSLPLSLSGNIKLYPRMTQSLKHNSSALICVAPCIFVILVNFVANKWTLFILFLYITLQVCRHVSTRVDHHRGISYIEHLQVIIIPYI
jgi:hypothetical protein